jgi:hypothetical protein
MAADTKRGRREVAQRLFGSLKVEVLKALALFEGNPPVSADE